MVDCDKLAKHPEHIKFFSEKLDEEFLESIKQHGVKVPIVVTKSTNKDLDNLVVCGRRRWLASQRLNIKQIPVKYWVCDDDIEIRRRLLIDNVKHEITLEEKVRMYNGFKVLFKEEADRRMPADVKTQFRAADQAAKAVGLGRHTAKAADEAVKTADALKAAGKTEEAAKVIETLNSGKAGKAAKDAKAAAKTAGVEAPAKPKKTKEPKVYPESEGISRALQAMKKSSEKFEKSRAEMVNAFDRKKETSPEFAAKHRGFITRCKNISELIDAVDNAMGTFEKAWTGYQAESEPQ